jgi:hypothetical protein
MLGTRAIGVLALSVGVLTIAVAGVSASMSRPFTGTVELVDPIEKIYAVSFLSAPLALDKVYPSMAGPYDARPIVISDAEPPQILWLTGYGVTVTDEAGQPLPSQVNLCHAQITHRDPELLQRTAQRFFPEGRRMPPKWFIVVPGQAHLSFPPGFALPMLSNEPLESMVMALQGEPQREPFIVRIRTTLTYRADQDLREPLEPLGRFAVAVTVPIDPAHI